LKYADLFVNRKIKHWFKIGGGYRIAGLNKDFGWLTEQRSMIFGNISKEIKSLEFTFSNRFENWMLNKAENHFRHKQKLTVELPELTHWKLRLYFAEETLEKFNSDKLHLARLFAGLQAFELKSFQLKFYYVLEKYKADNSWNTRDILGLSL
jgi:hypothetical protein